MEKEKTKKSLGLNGYTLNQHLHITSMKSSKMVSSSSVAEDIR